MVNNAFQSLRNLFYDRPDVLRMLDLREVDASKIGSEFATQQQKREGGFLEPVNLYSTGRTGAGKSSLGNRFLDDAPLVSTGHQDCTEFVHYFQLASNMRYYDLPGSGSEEEFENINRVALGLPQLEQEGQVTEFKVLDWADYLRNKIVPREEDADIYKVQRWLSSENQKFVAPDIILYVVAPHKGWGRDDRYYLEDLLKKQQGHSNKVIFALNLHRHKDKNQTENQTLKPTPENIQDARKFITQSYQKFYPNATPPIVEIDALDGTGIEKITELMCKILPANKIGNMQEVLRDDLKKFVDRERSNRYRKALIHIAARLATRKVDEKQGDQELLNEAYMAVTDYGIRVFREETAVLEAQKQLDMAINQLAKSAKVSREEAETFLVDRIIMKDQEVEKSDFIPEFKPVEIEQQVVDYTESQESRKELVDAGRSPGRIAGGTVVGGFAGLGGFAAGLMAAAAAGATIATGGLAAPLAASVIGGMVAGGAMGAKKQKKEVTVTEDVIKPVVKTIKTTEQRFVGMKEIKKKVVEKVPDVIREEQATGKINYLQGGYPVVENLLAIGLGIEKANPQLDLQDNFQAIVNNGRQEVKATLQSYAEQINNLAINQNARYAEEQIVNILERILLQLS
jgi:hypothetical protein